MRRTLILLLLLGFAHAEDSPPSVFTLLAEGKQAQAVTQLQASKRPSDLCLLGRLQALSGDEAGAMATWATVPLDAECGWSAAYSRADLLEKSGKVAEAAAIYKRLGDVALGDAGEGPLVSWMTRLAREILKREHGYEDAFELLEQGLSRRVGDAGRLTLAKELAEASLQKKRGYINQQTQILLAKAKDPQTRLLLAQVLPSAAGYALLSRLEATPKIRQLMAERALDIERGWGLYKLMTLEETTRALRWRALSSLIDDGRYTEAIAYAGPLLAGGDAYARQASQRLAELSLSAGHPLEAIALIEAHLKRFPSDEARPELERRLNSTRLALAQAAYEAKRFDEAIEHAEALINRDPKASEAPQAAYLAGLSAEGAGRHDEARRRWDEAIARWPSHHNARTPLMSLARRAAKGGELKGFFKRLEAMGSYSDIIDEFKRPWLFLETQGRQIPGQAVVRVLGRNIKALEARVHRIDAEAFLRNGGRPSTLAALDVAVIAPDRRWKVPLPEHKPHEVIDFPLPLKDLKPGYYRLTVSADAREASVVVWISDARLIAQTAGEDLVAAVFKGEAPAAKAKLFLHTSEGVKEAETDAAGLYKGKLPKGPVIVLAQVGEAPALLNLDRDCADLPEAQPQFQADLDRYVYRAGDQLHFRIVGRKGAAPITGRWVVTLDDGLGQALTLESTPWGTVSGAFKIATSALSDPLKERTTGRGLTLMIKPEGGEQAYSVAQAIVLPSNPQPSLAIAVEGDEGVITLRDGAGAPVVGAAVTWRLSTEDEERVSRTDARGQIKVKGPEGIPFSLNASHGQLNAQAERRDPRWPRLELKLTHEELTPGAPLEATLAGLEGEVEVRLSYASVPKAPKQPEDPLTLKYKRGFELQGFKHAHLEHNSGGEHLLGAVKVQLKGKDTPVKLAFPGVKLEAEGQYVLRAVSLGARASSATRYFTVFNRPLALEGIEVIRAGETVRPTLKASAPALVLIRGLDGLIAGQILEPGEALPWSVDPTLDRVHFSAYTADGQAYERLIYPERALKVALKHSVVDGLAGQHWRAEVTVTDPAGKPVVAEVAVVIDDEALNQRAGGSPARINNGLFVRAGDRERVGGIAATLTHGAEAQQIAEALREEAQRRREATRRKRARHGRFERNRVAQVMKQDRQMIQLDSIAIQGVGNGGGGMGYGGLGNNSIGLMDQSAVSIGGLQGVGVPAPILWGVGQTDAQGKLTIEAPAPSHVGGFTLSARAITATGFGAERLPLKDVNKRVRLHLEQPSAGHPGEVAHLWPQIINDTEAPFEGILLVDKVAHPVVVGAGEALRLDLGAKAPGAKHALTLRSKTGAIASASWAFPLAAGLPTQGGAIVEVAFGPGGGFPTAWLALREDPFAAGSPIRAARAGAALLMASELRAHEQLRALYLESLRGYAITAFQLYDATHAEAAEVLRFLHDASKVLNFPARRLEPLHHHLDDPVPEARLTVAYTRALLGLPISKALLSRLAQIPEADLESRALYARLLIALGRPAEAKAFAKGDGPHAIIARAALGEDVSAARAALRKTTPPAVGTPGLADWLAATAGAPAKPLEGWAQVYIDGQLHSPMPLASGAAIRFLTKPGAAVTLKGAPDGLILRYAPVAGAGEQPHAARLPFDESGRFLERCPDDELTCGAADKPCLASVGEHVQISHDLSAPGLHLPAGLELVQHMAGRRLIARLPGRYTLSGLKGEDGALRPIHLEVLPEAPRVGHVCQGAALSLAQGAAKLGEDPEIYLKAWTRDEDWGYRLPQVTRLRFDQAKAAEGEAQAAQVVEAFEALRAADNGASLTFEEMAQIASAYAASDRPGRALDVWRAGLTAAFKDESASIQESQRYVGELAVIKALRQAADRYPQLPEMDEALSLLPQLIADMAEGDISQALKDKDITATDLKLMAAAWAREFLLTQPKSDKHPELGFQLTQLLLDLNAPERAAAWAQRIMAAHPKSKLVDGLLYLEGLARSQLRQDKAAFAIFKRLSTEQFPLGDDRVGPAPSKGDALYAMGRLYEAAGDLEAAKKAYAESTGVPEAKRASVALERVMLKVDALLKIKAKEALKLEVTASNVDSIDLRAYRLDLRTLFIRDKGLGDPNQILVDGLQPIWSDTRALQRSAFPEVHALDLPLAKPGAYLVRVMGAGRSSTTLVIRSDLELISFTSGGKLYVRARRDGKAIADAFVRGANHSQVVAKKTDLRGVVILDSGMNALVIDGEHIAVEAAKDVVASSTPMPAQPSYDFDDEEAGEAMQRNIKRRYKRQIRGNRAKFKKNFNFKSSEVNINAF